MNNVNIVDYEDITMEDCMRLYVSSNIRTDISNGKIVGFEMEGFNH